MKARPVPVVEVKLKRKHVTIRAYVKDQAKEPSIHSRGEPFYGVLEKWQGRKRVLQMTVTSREFVTRAVVEESLEQDFLLALSEGVLGEKW